MAKLIGADASAAGWCAAPWRMRWAHSSRDGLVHAFPIEERQQGPWLRPVCSDTVPLAALGPAHRGRPALPALRAGRRGRVRRATPLGSAGSVCARLLGCRRRHRPDPQPAPLAQVPDITLPLTTAEPAEYELRVRGMAEPGRGAASGLVPSALVCHDSGAAR